MASRQWTSITSYARSGVFAQRVMNILYKSMQSGAKSWTEYPAASL
jgi:hypothetical protein